MERKNHNAALAVLSAVALFGAFRGSAAFAAEGALPGSTGFEAAAGDVDAYWRGTPEACARIAPTEYGESENPASAKPRAQYFAGSPNTRYLAIDVADAEQLYRKIAPSRVDIADGIYFDSFVRFTSGLYVRPPARRQKILISSVKRGNSACLVVTAGFISPANESITPRTYIIDSAEIKDDEWYRLTIEAIDDIGAGYVGFKIYLDGRKLSSAEAKSDSAEIPVPADIFPSLVRTGIYKRTVGAVRFRGKGAIDDLVFTRTNPFLAENISFGDGAFTIPGDKVEELKVLLKVQDLSLRAGDRRTSYAEAYALGLVEESTGEVADIGAPEISIAPDGTVTIDEIAFPRSKYKITERLQAKTGLDGEWKDVSAPGNARNMQMRFYRLLITIENGE